MISVVKCQVSSNTGHCTQVSVAQSPAMSPCLAEEMLDAESPTFLIKQHTQLLGENGGLSLLRGTGKVGRCRVFPGRHVLQTKVCGGKGGIDRS